ncbi:P-loop ATPase, Sll1717 family [Isoptericola sp. NPDC058082]|uniref:P-loop ATPase, Sll1717 family n=1 Tax=Isoptericola sp. NPDC058082 TaxID=3346331 RepID=UPI0036F145E1
MTSNETPTVASLLSKISLGSPVAEFDTALADYFIETDTFARLRRDEGDTVAGDKGTGKSALFRILKERYTSYADLGDVEVLPAFNPAGTPVFQRLLDAGVLQEPEYTRVWKAYFLMLAGNWLLELHGDARPGSLKRLDEVLTKGGMRSNNSAPQSLFSQLVDILRPETVESTWTISPDGIPLVATKASFGRRGSRALEPAEFVRHDDALRLLENCLEETGFKLWLVLDRLDEAFQATPDVEHPALRALFRAYLDMQDFTHVRPKLFIRNDLLGRVIVGGFVNLTHVNARKITITWEDADLYALLIQRIKESRDFVAAADLDGMSDDEIFDRVFPAQVDPGLRRPTTWKWILTRIRDGNDVKSPRNLVDLVTKAVAAQQRREASAGRNYVAGEPLLTGDALKRALLELSKERVEDTLLAEAGSAAATVRLFENGKAEHNPESLATILGPENGDAIKRLVGLGFLEQTGPTYKVPMLYRGGMAITNGKAFASGGKGDGEVVDDGDELD